MGRRRGFRDFQRRQAINNVMRRTAMGLNACAYMGNLAGPDCIVWLIVPVAFVLDIFALVEILKSRAEATTKILWVLVVWLMPWLGLILYYTIGRESMKSA